VRAASSSPVAAAPHLGYFAFEAYSDFSQELLLQGGDDFFENRTRLWIVKKSRVSVVLCLGVRLVTGKPGLYIAKAIRTGHVHRHDVEEMDGCGLIESS